MPEYDDRANGPFIEARVGRQEAGGSNPLSRSILNHWNVKNVLRCSSAWVEHLCVAKEAGGSNPFISATSFPLGCKGTLWVIPKEEPFVRMRRMTMVVWCRRAANQKCRSHFGLPNRNARIGCSIRSGSGNHCFKTTFGSFFCCVALL